MCQFTILFLLILIRNFVVIKGSIEDNYLNNGENGGNESAEGTTDNTNDNDVAFLEINDSVLSLDNFSADYISMNEFMNNRNIRRVRDTAVGSDENTSKNPNENNTNSGSNILSNSSYITYSEKQYPNEEAGYFKNISEFTAAFNLSSELNGDVKLQNSSRKDQSPVINTNKTKYETNVNSLKKPISKSKPGSIQNGTSQLDDKLKSSNKVASNLSTGSDAVISSVNTSLLNGQNDSFSKLASNTTVTKEATSIESKSLQRNDNITHSSRQVMLENNDSFSTWNILLILGLCVVVISTVTGIGILSTVAYRRYYWNKPQTFSDKCSNADSSGYIDDSTMKENSEEMYSLDNDSFLNSLEAMTIQNYWADSIRHTKL